MQKFSDYYQNTPIERTLINLGHVEAFVTRSPLKFEWVKHGKPLRDIVAVIINKSATTTELHTLLATDRHFVDQDRGRRAFLFTETKYANHPGMFGVVIQIPIPDATSIVKNNDHIEMLYNIVNSGPVGTLERFKDFILRIGTMGERFVPVNCGSEMTLQFIEEHKEFIHRHFIMIDKIEDLWRVTSPEPLIDFLDGLGLPRRDTLMLKKKYGIRVDYSDEDMFHVI